MTRGKVVDLKREKSEMAQRSLKQEPTPVTDWAKAVAMISTRKTEALTESRQRMAKKKMLLATTARARTQNAD